MLRMVFSVTPTGTLKYLSFENLRNSMKLQSVVLQRFTQQNNRNPISLNFIRTQIGGKFYQ